MKLNGKKVEGDVNILGWFVIISIRCLKCILILGKVIKRKEKEYIICVLLLIFVYYC